MSEGVYIRFNITRVHKMLDPGEKPRSCLFCVATKSVQKGVAIYEVQEVITTDGKYKWGERKSWICSSCYLEHDWFPVEPKDIEKAKEAFVIP